MKSERPGSGSRAYVIGCALAVLCMVCLVVAGGLGAYYYGEQTGGGLLQLLVDPSPAPATMAPTAENVPTEAPTPTPAPAGPAPRNPLAGGALPTALARDSNTAKPDLVLDVPLSIVQELPTELSWQQRDALLQADYPVHDFYEAGQRLGRLNVGPRTVSAPAYQIGDRQSFYVDDGEREAILMAVTEHTYFWVEDSLNFDSAAVETTARRFEEEYYPRLVHIFGQEWRPGVDNDPHFSILHLDYMDISTDELGHFNSGDEYPRSFFSDSNQQELLYLNMGNLTLSSDLYFGTLVHEFQHLAQWYVDANETAWLNEGLSQLAEISVGLETAETVDYLLAPDTQLNSWTYTGDSAFAHYAGSYLLCVYLWEQLGDAAVQELARHPSNGIASVDAVLKGFRPDLSLEEFMADWVAANYLDHDAPGTQYAYRALDLRRPVSVAGVKFAPHEILQTLNQFAAHYIDLDVPGTTTISFAGDTRTRFLPTVPYSGEQVWFAPVQDNVNAQLTGRFDLSALDSATLTFWVWHDLTFDLDYGYVSVSEDNGQTWELLELTHGHPGEYGATLHGRSDEQPDAQKGGWIQESISLDTYAGRQILIRFELLTYYDSDARGLALDDIAIPELGFMDDVEGTGESWQASGFVQVGSQLPQTWRVQLIHKGDSPRVAPLDLDAFNQGQWTVDIGAEGAVLAVMPMTPYTTEPADYWLAIAQ